MRLTTSSAKAKRRFANNGSAVTTGFLLDTNHISRAVIPKSPVRQRITNLRQRGIKLGKCVPVLCEIEAGIQQASQPMFTVSTSNSGAPGLRQIRVWPINPSTARLYGVIHHDLKRRGRVLSHVDVMLAAPRIKVGNAHPTRL